MRGAFIASLLCLACSEPQSSLPSKAEARVTALEQRTTVHTTAVDAVSRQAQTLTGEFTQVGKAYAEVSATYERARLKYAQVQTNAEAASQSFQGAARDFDEATKLWTWYRHMVQFAAYIDAQNLAKLREVSGRGGIDRGTPDCDNVSTARHREHLRADGVGLDNKHIDHIVPRSLGGADHPWNYQVMNASENMSWGNEWSVAKCATAGPQCALAVAISIKCGSFRL